MINKSSIFEDFVRFRLHTYARTQQSLPSLWAAIVNGSKLLKTSEHILIFNSNEPIKLNGVEFKSKQLVLEEAKTKHKDRTLDKQNPPDHQFKNYCVNIMHQHEQQQGHQHHQLQQRQKE